MSKLDWNECADPFGNKGYVLYQDAQVGRYFVTVLLNGEMFIQPFISKQRVINIYDNHNERYNVRGFEKYLITLPKDFYTVKYPERFSLGKMSKKMCERKIQEFQASEEAKIFKDTFEYTTNIFKLWDEQQTSLSTPT